MPRSGTSLAEQILASHPAVFGAGEVIFWDTAFAAYRRAELEVKIAGTQAGANLIRGMAGDYLDRLTAIIRRRAASDRQDARQFLVLAD